MNKNFFFSFLIFLMYLINSVHAEIWDPLTKGQADILYCPVGGVCTLDTLTVYDLYIIGTVFNVTVTNIYLNVTYLQGIENYATKENLETNITDHEENFKHGNNTDEILGVVSVNYALTTDIDNWISTNDTSANASMKVYVDNQDSAQDECSEITGCVENALMNDTPHTVTALTATTVNDLMISSTSSTFTLRPLGGAQQEFRYSNIGPPDYTWGIGPGGGGGPILGVTGDSTINQDVTDDADVTHNDMTLTGNLTVTGDELIIRADGSNHVKAVLANTGGPNPTNAAAYDLLEGTSGDGNFGTTNNFGFRMKLDGATNQYIIQSGSATTVTNRLWFGRDNNKEFGVRSGGFLLIGDVLNGILYVASGSTSGQAGFYLTNDPTDPFNSGKASFGMLVNTVEAQLMQFVADNAGNQIIFTNLANRNADHDHVTQTDPLVCVHSDTSPDDDNTQWLCYSHNKTQGIISTGKGNLFLDSATGNITMKSPDGTHWNCGVDNGGTFSCS